MSQKHDIFISYRRSSNWELGELLFQTLKGRGYNPFFDLERIDRGDDFTIKIQNTIKDCNDFIILIRGDDLLRCDESEDDWILKEVKFAFKYHKHIIPIFVGDNVNQNVKNETILNLLKINGIALKREYFTTVINIIIDSLISVPSSNVGEATATSSEDEKIHEKIENKYDTTRFKAQERLSVQQTIIKPYNDKIFNRLLKDKHDIEVLDLGSNNGNTIMKSVVPSFDVKHIIGLEYSDKMHEAAKKYLGNSVYIPYKQDVEAEDFVDSLKQICEENNIDGFDLIYCGFLLLHLKKPGILIRRIKKFLKPDGYLFIRDVDDLQIVSFPDPQKIVKTFKDIDGKVAHTGYRWMGRELYTNLKHAEYRDIEIIPEDISTIGRDYDERMDLMNMNFSYIKENVVDMINPEKPSKFDGYLTWVEEHYDDLENLFADSTYYFKAGIISIIARR